MIFTKRLNFFVFALASLIIYTSCSPRPYNSSPERIIRDITAKEAHKLILNNRNNQNFVIIDVRTLLEYKKGRIENSLNINYNSEIFKEKIEQLDKNNTYLIYCQYGGRSKRALEIMEKNGFQRIYNLSEGLIGWKSAGYSTNLEN